MTLKDLISFIKFLDEQEKKKRNASPKDRRKKKKKTDEDYERLTRKSVLESDIPIIAETGTKGNRIIVFRDGLVLFEDQGNYTIFSIYECDSFSFTSIFDDEGCSSEDIPYANRTYTRDFIYGSKWPIGLAFVGQAHIDKNRGKRSYYTPLEEVTIDGSMDYGEIKVDVFRNKNIYYGDPDFADTTVTRMDVDHFTEELTEEQRSVIHAHYWEEKSFQDIGSEMDGKKDVARMRAKGLHDRGMNSLRRRHEGQMDEYRKE